MSWTRRVKHPSKVVALGDVVEAVVLDVDVENGRISLGMKQLEPNPYDKLTEKYPVGSLVKGKVRNIADFGVFVEIEDGIDGIELACLMYKTKFFQCSRIHLLFMFSNLFPQFQAFL